MSITIRPLRHDDYQDVGRIFFCAVHEGTRAAYTYAQRRAWAGDTIDLVRWQKRVAELTGFMAQDASEPVGFMTIDQMGYVDLAFVLPSYAGKGVGTALLDAVEKWAQTNDVPRLTTAASLVARPFFERHGWRVLEEEIIKRHDVSITRFQMEKLLAKAN